MKGETMQKQLFYKDNQKTFFMDHVFFETKYPIFFSCIDENGELYIATFCDTREELRWILAKITQESLIQMIYDQISLYELYDQSKTYYVIQERNGKRSCNIYDNATIDKLDFPTKGEYLEAEKEEIEEYTTQVLSEYNEYRARVFYDPDDRIFFGEVIGISDSLYFHGRDIRELEGIFHQNIDNYLEICQKMGRS